MARESAAEPPWVAEDEYRGLQVLLESTVTAAEPLAHLGLARAAWELGFTERARRHLDEARHVLLKQGALRMVALAYVWLARVEWTAGDDAQAEVALDKARQMFESEATPQDLALCAAVAAETACARSDRRLPEAIEEVHRRGQALADERWSAWALQIEALSALRSGDRDGARRNATRCLPLAEGAGGTPDLAWRMHAVLSDGLDGPEHRARARGILDAILAQLSADGQAAFLRRSDRTPYLDLLDGPATGPVRRAARDLRSLSAVIRTMISESSVDSLLRCIVDSMVETTGAESGLLVLIGNGKVDLSVRRAAGRRDLGTDEVPLSVRIARDVASSGRSLCLADASADPHWKGVESVAEKRLRSVLCVPLRFRERSMGSVFIESRARAEAFQAADVEIAEVLADQAAIALENALLQSKLVTDPLTGTATHPHFEQRLAEELSRAERNGRPCSLMLVDLDRFKSINDTYGHDAGSRLLRSVGEVLHGVTRLSDLTGRASGAGPVVGRYGGDEFELVLPETGRGGLARAAERLLGALRETRFEAGGTAVEVTASVGGATFPDDGANASDLFLRADEALYASKRAGRNRFTAYRSPVAPVSDESAVDSLLLSRYGRDVVLLLTQVLGAGSDLQAALDRALQCAVKATGAERGFLLLFGNSRDVLIRSAFQLPEEAFSPERFRISFGVITRLVREGKPLRVENVSSDVQFGGSPSVQELGLNSFLAVPIPGEASPIGIVYLDSTSSAKSFTAEDELLLIRFAGLLARSLPSTIAAHEHALELAELRRVITAGLKDLQAQYRFDALIGESAAIRQLRSTLDHVVRFPYPVLIVGETGTGKEVVAKAIHSNSPRKDHPIVAVNCAALPRELIESELFGHVRGAFTGADRDRPGLFRAAHQGTLFLDEIGEVPEDVQRKLLRVLQDGEFVPVGSTTPQKSDVRVIAATNRDLEVEVREGRFREDLYYRLKVFQLALPPLRERPGDIPILARFLLKKAVAEVDASPREFHADTLSVLVRHPWPGNVRELENAIKHAIAFSGDIVQPDHLPAEVVQGSRGARAQEAVEAAASGPRKSTDELWKILIERTLEEVGWNHSTAAKLLGVSRTTLYHKIKSFGIQRQV